MRTGGPLKVLSEESFQKSPFRRALSKVLLLSCCDGFSCFLMFFSCVVKKHMVTWFQKQFYQKQIRFQPLDVFITVLPHSLISVLPEHWLQAGPFRAHLSVCGFDGPKVSVRHQFHHCFYLIFFDWISTHVNDFNDSTCIQHAFNMCSLHISLQRGLGWACL